MKDRELNSILRFVPGYLASQLSWRNGKPQGFALFATPEHAIHALYCFNGLIFDEDTMLRAEMANNNLTTASKSVMRPYKAIGMLEPAQGGNNEQLYMIQGENFTAIRTCLCGWSHVTAVVKASHTCMATGSRPQHLSFF